MHLYMHMLHLVAEQLEGLARDISHIYVQTLALHTGFPHGEQSTRTFVLHVESLSMRRCNPSEVEADPVYMYMYMLQP